MKSGVFPGWSTSTSYRILCKVLPAGPRRPGRSAGNRLLGEESVGISAGLFITVVHHMGPTTLTHTPSPMGFLGELLGRPTNETVVLLLPVGHPAKDARTPKPGRKTLEEILQWNRGQE